jgi:hypothetical protein
MTLIRVFETWDVTVGEPSSMLTDYLWKHIGRNVKDRGVTGGGGVNGSQIKFFSRISLCPKIKTQATSVLEGDEITFQ